MNVFISPETYLFYFDLADEMSIF